MEHRVVRHEPIGLLLGREAARAGIDLSGSGLRRLGGHGAGVDIAGCQRLLRCRQRDRPGAVAVEERGTVEAVLRVGSGLQPEQLFWIPQVINKTFWHGLVGEQVRECRLPHLQHRVVAVVDIEDDRAVVCIDYCLHTVAHVVQRPVEPGATVELGEVGALTVGVPTARRVAVDHPDHVAVVGNRVRVAIEGKERRQLLHSLAGVADHQQLRIVVDCARAQQVVIPLVERECQPASGGRQRNAVVAFVRRDFDAGAGRLGDRRVDDRIAGERRAEVQLRAVEVDDVVAIGGVAAGLDLSCRRHHQTATVGVDEVRALPRLVADLVEVELASANEHLARHAVDLVAVGVEIVDGLAGVTPVGLESGDHLALGLEQPNITKRLNVFGHLRAREAAELDIFHHDVVEAEGMAGGFDVVFDVLGFLVLLVWVDYQRLHNAGVDHPADQSDNDPQRGGHDSGAPLVGLQRAEVQARGEQRDERQQQHRRQLGIVDRVGDAAHHTAIGGGQFVTGDPVVARLEDGEHRQQHRHMCLRCPTEFRLRRLDQDAARQDVRGHHQQCDEQHRQEQPVEHERDEWQLEHVEADVVAKVLIRATERLAVAEHQPVLPASDGRCREQQAEDHGDSEAEQPHAMTEELVEALDQWVGVGRETGRRKAIGDDQVQ